MSDQTVFYDFIKHQQCMCHLALNQVQYMDRVVQNKLQKFAHEKLWTICHRIRLLATNWQRLLSNDQFQICINGLNLLCWLAGSC